MNVTQISTFTSMKDTSMVKAFIFRAMHCDKALVNQILYCLKVNDLSECKTVVFQQHPQDFESMQHLSKIISEYILQKKSRVRKKTDHTFHINKCFQPFHSCFGKITVGMVIPPDTTISVNKKKAIQVKLCSNKNKQHVIESKYITRYNEVASAIGNLPMPSRTEMFGRMMSFELTRKMSPKQR